MRGRATARCGAPRRPQGSCACARQRRVELPLVISDHADWPDLLRTIRETGARQIWVTHGQEDALVRQCQLDGRHARPLRVDRDEDGE